MQRVLAYLNFPLVIHLVCPACSFSWIPYTSIGRLVCAFMPYAAGIISDIPNSLYIKTT